ncbi:MAG: hypothetical protein GYA36_19380 [Veillonellaceae bacterium]|nr:hypothetical protein [Veillonellaceae bacterium]
MSWWERYPYHSLDDLKTLVEAAAKLSTVLEMRVRAGLFEVRMNEGATQTLVSVRLPSDDLLERVKTDGVEWKVLHHGNVRAALMEGVATMRREGLHASHLASGDLQGLLRALKMYNSEGDPGLAKWLGGLELVDHRGFGTDVHLLCGGPRVHGSIADITMIVRLEEEP